MKSIDLTVVATVHAETAVAGPTMRSASVAIAFAVANGFTVERLLAFDTPSDGCRAFFDHPAYCDWVKYEFEFRDQGKTRNAAIEMAKGRWVALLDGDDLFSENWLVEALQMLRDAEARDRSIIVHPELNWIFDAGEFVFLKPAQLDPLFSSYYLSCVNCYDALCVAPRQVWRDHPYPERAIRDGFAYEDWEWAIETMAAGWKHEVALNTIIFKRRRDASQMHESRRNAALIRAIDATAIERVLTFGGAVETHRRPES